MKRRENWKKFFSKISYKFAKNLENVRTVSQPLLYQSYATNKACHTYIVSKLQDQNRLGFLRSKYVQAFDTKCPLKFGGV